MLLSDVFDEQFSSVTVIGANGKSDVLGKVFESNSFVGFYFHHENSTGQVSTLDGTESGVHQQLKPCQTFLEHAKSLIESGCGDSNGESNSKKAKSNGGGNTSIAIVFVATSENAKDDEGKIECVVGQGISHDFVWAISANEQRAKVLLMRTYKIRLTPAFVVVDARTKQTIAVDGRRALQADPQGKRFPWHLPEPADVFCGQLVKKSASSGEAEMIDVADLGRSVKCLLFAAHWCPPCRSFVKQLTQTYCLMKEAQSSTDLQFEVIFCSMDRCEESFQQFYADMPWVSFPYNDPRCIAASRLYNVQEIPTLIVLDADNQLITRHGKCELALDPTGKEFPWYPKLILEMNSHTMSRLREDISFLLFTEGTSEDLVFAHTSLLPVAEEFCLRSGPDQQDMLFFYCGDDPMCDQLWDNLSLGDASLPLICIIDPFTDTLYVSDDPTVSEVLIRRFIEKFFTGDLEPTRRFVSTLTPAANRGNFVLNSPQQPIISFGSNDSGAKMQSERSCPPASDSSTGAKRLCVNVAGTDTSSTQRYCCL